MEIGSQGGVTHLVNPGTIGGVGKAAANWVFADLERMEFDLREVSKSIEYGAGSTGDV